MTDKQLSCIIQAFRLINKIHSKSGYAQEDMGNAYHYFRQIERDCEEFADKNLDCKLDNYNPQMKG